MSLPPFFSDPAEYFDKCMIFLNEYSWIYTTSNTQFMKECLFERFPKEWQTFFSSIEIEDLNRFPEGLNSKNSIPESLDLFQNNLSLLKPHVTLSANITQRTNLTRISPKKSHEIIQLANLIADKCKNNIEILVDFGSGLGYLSEILYSTNHFKILGLECDPQRVRSAIQRQTLNYPESIPNVAYSELRITSFSGNSIQNLVKEKFINLQTCNQAVIGLHACADLSITAMQLFLQTDNMKKLIIMPCCYHKLELLENSKHKRIFKNFPLSSDLMKFAKATPSGFTMLNRPFLRLACQQTVSHWRTMNSEDHKRHGREMFLRGVVECLACDDEIVTKLRGRNCRINDDISFERIISQYELNLKATNERIEWCNGHRDRFIELFKEYPNGSALCEGLTCLQTALQALFENIVLLDRKLYLEECAKEMGIRIAVEVQKILDDKLSPRCFVFIAEKL